MRAILSLGIACVAVYVILFRPEDGEARYWAFSALGVLLWYWLRVPEARQRA